MTEHTDFELLELATPYALNAVSDDERADIDRRVVAAPSPVAAAFNDEVRAVRETMAVVSAATTAEPPAHLRTAILDATKPEVRRQSRWRTAAFASAAAIAVGLGAFGLGVLTRPSPPPHRGRASSDGAGRTDGLSPTGRRDGHGGVLPRPQHRSAGDEQCGATIPGNRVSDVAAGRGQRAEVGGDDGHRGGDALDDGDADRSRSLDRTGIHRRTRHRITTAHRYHLGRAAARVSRGRTPRPLTAVSARQWCPASRRTRRVPLGRRCRLASGNHRCRRSSA